MENLPKFEVIGAVSEEKKEEFAIKRRDIFIKQQDLMPEGERKKLEAVEYDKTPEQIAALDFIDQETNRLLQECGVEPIDIPAKNYHILPKEEMDKFFHTSSAGTYEGSKYAIGLSSELRKSLLMFVTVAFHEALHMKARQIWQLYEDREGKLKNKIYRSGMRVFSPRKKNMQGRSVTHFSGLDEAVVAWQEKLSFPRLLNIPELKEEKDKYEQEDSKAKRQKIAEERGIPDDEIFWLDLVDKSIGGGAGYYWQRKVVEYVCEEIVKEFPEEYQNKEEVHREFLKANLNGNLIPIARLMKKTFGDTGLRALGMMKSKDEDGALDNVMEMLRKMRTLHRHIRTNG